MNEGSKKRKWILPAAIWAVIFAFGVLGSAYFYWFSGSQMFVWGDLLVTSIPFIILVGILFHYSFRIRPQVEDEPTASLESDSPPIVKRNPYRGLILSLLAAVGVAIPNVNVFNRWLDDSEEQTEEVAIREKGGSSLSAWIISGGPYYVTFMSPFGENRKITARIDKSHWDDIRPGVSVVELTFREGRLGILYLTAITRASEK